MPQVKAILFDIDGTLVDSNEHHITAWVGAFERNGFHFDRHTIHDQVGKGGDNLVPALVPNVSPDLQEKLDAAHGEIFKHGGLPPIKPFPDARELLERTRAAGIKVILASSASREELERHVETLQARDLIDEATCKDDVEHSKPCPDIFVAALGKAAPVRPEEAFVIGDTPYDMKAARRAGIAPIGLRSGRFPDEALREGGAVAIYDDVAHLLAEIDSAIELAEAEAVS
jgi:HAD superfamily hydrolase (TIGR01509 family)